MIVGFVGDEVVDLITGKGEWVENKINQLLDRILEKYPNATFITGNNTGVEAIALKQIIKRGLTCVVVVTEVDYHHRPASLTFFSFKDWTFISEYADYVIIIRNGQVHKRLDLIAESSSKYLTVNYLLATEKWS